MAILLNHPPTRPQIHEVQLPDVVAANDEAASFQHWWRHLAAHDQIEALLLAIGEYGALAHGAVWFALLSLIDNGKKPATRQETHHDVHSGLAH